MCFPWDETVGLDGLLIARSSTSSPSRGVGPYPQIALPMDRRRGRGKCQLKTRPIPTSVSAGRVAQARHIQIPPPRAPVEEEGLAAYYEGRTAALFAFIRQTTRQRGERTKGGSLDAPSNSQILDSLQNNNLPEAYAYFPESAYDPFKPPEFYSYASEGEMPESSGKFEELPGAHAQVDRLGVEDEERIFELDF